MSSWLKWGLDSLSGMSTRSKIGAGIIGGFAVAALGYKMLRSKDNKTNDYFKLQDSWRSLSLTAKSEPQGELGDMMFQRNAHSGKGKPLV